MQTLFSPSEDLLLVKSVLITKSLLPLSPLFAQISSLLSKSSIDWYNRWVELKEQLEGKHWNKEEDSILDDWVRLKGEDSWEELCGWLEEKEPIDIVYRWYGGREEEGELLRLLQREAYGEQDDEVRSMVASEMSGFEEARGAVGAKGKGTEGGMEKRWEKAEDSEMGNEWKVNEDGKRKVTDVGLVEYYMAISGEEHKGQQDDRGREDGCIEDSRIMEDAPAVTQSKKEKHKKVTKKLGKKTISIVQDEQVGHLDNKDISDIDRFENFVKKNNANIFKHKYKKLIENELETPSIIKRWSLSHEILLIQLYDRYGPEWLLFTSFYPEENMITLKFRFYHIIKKYYYINFRHENTLKILSPNIQNALIDFYKLQQNNEQLLSENQIDKEIIMWDWNWEEDELDFILQNDSNLISKKDFEYKSKDESNPYLVSFISTLIKILNIDVSDFPSKVKYEMDGFIDFFKSSESIH